jgi:holliday junction DNA helicase RuvA
MISKIRGKIEYLKNNYAVVDVSGVGYKVFLSAYTFGKVAGMSAKSESVSGGEEIGLFIHTYVREDTLALYGFLNQEELEMFELLISISGIGPKAGMGILSIATPKTIRTAILNEDPSILTKVSGIGKKTAERVILELRNKVVDMTTGEKEEATIDSDAIEALLTMGYSVTEARDALKIVPLDVKDVGARVKMALRNLGRK